MVAIGLISYPLYLWHWPLLSYARILELGAPSWQIRALCLAASFPLAWGTYLFFEKPIRFGHDKRRNTVLVSVLMLCAGLSGLVVFAGKGMPGRFPALLAFEDIPIDADWDKGSCFTQMAKDAPFKGEENECVLRGNGKLVALWGDSYAEALMPGLKRLQKEKGFSLAHMTAAACPPLMDWVHPGREWCKKRNDDTFAAILKLRPDTLILHATWTYVHFDEGFAQTLKKLKESGIKKIVVIGPLPMWKQDLPSILFQHLRRGDIKDIPLFDKEDLSQNHQELNGKLAEMVQKAGFDYIDAQKLLCVESGCRVTIENPDKTLITHDVGHFTPRASEWFIRLIEDKILSEP